MTEKKWNLLSVDEKKTISLQEALKINKTICSILVNRGIDSFDAAKAFFRPSLQSLHDPFLMKDMKKAVDRIEAAINNKEKILIFGDYDVDGTTAVASFYQFINQLYDENYSDFYIPHRYNEGYGVSKKGIDFAADNHFSLIICLDCGIKSVELIDYAKSLNIDFIICDHHLPGNILPKATAILNPKQHDCNYPYKDLCGCGVGFKLMTALAIHYNLNEESYLCYLDLLATAIAADIVPITGENRILAFHGMIKINKNPSPGIHALIKLGGIKKQLTITNVVFVIAPRVNAAGRMDDAKKAVLLFIEKDENKAMEIGSLLQTDNSDRKEIDSDITQEALNIIQSDNSFADKKACVLYREHWHKGVVGIVASRIIEHHYKPTIVLTKSGDTITGSARSIKGFNLYEAIYQCKDHLLHYGGHFAAAGLSLLPENLKAFSDKFYEVTSNTIDESLLTPEIIVDAEINLNEINLGFFNILSQMEPFGPDNMNPVFIVKNIINNGYSKILKDKHIKFEVLQNNSRISGIGFNMADKFNLLQNKQPVDIVFSLEENEYNGNISIQMKVIDFRKSQQ